MYELFKDYKHTDYARLSWDTYFMIVSNVYYVCNRYSSTAASATIVYHSNTGYEEAGKTVILSSFTSVDILKAEYVTFEYMAGLL